MVVEKYIKIGVAAAVIAAVAIVGVMFLTGNSKEEEKAQVQELDLDGDKKKKVDIPIDFEELWAINSDVYAYIEIPGTKVSYPILQSADGSVDYLNMTLEKTEGLPGSIYTENVNSRDFHENNTIIYGHDMNDGSMFGSLHDYDDETFFRENSEILVYLPDEAIKYHVYAAVVFDDRYIPKSYNFDTLEDRARFIEDLKSFGQQPAYFNEEFAPTDRDSMITLSTCISDQPSNRWLIIGVRDDEEP